MLGNRRRPGKMTFNMAIGMTTGGIAVTDVLNLPRPAWMTEDVILLEDQARRFIAAEFVPHLEKWHEDKFYPGEVWTKAGAAGLLCASIPEEYGGGGGTFAHEAVITANIVRRLR